MAHGNRCGKGLVYWNSHQLKHSSIYSSWGPHGDMRDTVRSEVGQGEDRNGMTGEMLRKEMWLDEANVEVRTGDKKEDVARLAIRRTQKARMRKMKSLL